MKDITLFNKNSTIKLIKKKKKVFFFGSGIISEKTIKNIDLPNKFSGIFDNSSTLWDTNQEKIKILNPKIIKKLNRSDFLIIITTTSFADVFDQLKNEFKLIYGKDFIISFILNDQISIENIQSLDKTILFTSGAPKNINKNFGGGLYKIELNKENWTTKKIYSGNCYGLIKHDNFYYVVDTDIGIIKFNEKFNIIKKFKLEKGLRAHGLSYCKISKKFALASSYKDKIVIFNDKWKKIKELKISSKYNEDKTAQHHCNDCELINNNVYVSMFSITGNWKKDSYDGGILEINIFNKKKQCIIHNLWMPHNVKYFNGTIHVLDSLKGNLLYNNFNIQGTFPAFTRGLDYKDGLFYIGQSRNRNFSKFLGLSNNISVDTGVIIFEPDLKISRFIQVSNKISEIHSVLTI